MDENGVGLGMRPTNMPLGAREPSAAPSRNVEASEAEMAATDSGVVSLCQPQIFSAIRKIALLESAEDWRVRTHGARRTRRLMARNGHFEQV
jgi:hypothetical protein